MRQTFGSFIRATREKQGFSLRQFSIGIGISPSFVSQMERGLVAAPSEARIKQMAEFLGRNSDELLALSGRVSTDVLDIILQDPIETCALIRRLQHASKNRKKQSIQAVEANELEFYPLVRLSLENHTAIIGESGSGKSVLTQYLIQNYFKKAEIKVYDSDAAPHDWKRLSVKGKKANYLEIAQEMLADLDELQRRTELLGEGHDPGKEVVRIVEEWPSTAAELLELYSVQNDFPFFSLKRVKNV
jgi:HTH-type transcriptional regulator, competence development regulator